MTDHPIPSANPEVEAADEIAQTEVNLGRAAAGGFMWLLSATVLGKIISLICNVMVSWYIVREDGDLVAMTFMVMTFANLIREWGTAQVLMSRGKRFHLWAPVGFWLTLSLGLIGMIAMIGVAPVIAWVMHEPKLLTLILMMAVLQPIQASCTVPLVKLQLDLRFRIVAYLAILLGPGNSVLILAFAYFGGHAYSYIFASIIVTVLRAIICWWLEPTHVGLRPRPNRWKYLASDSAIVGIGWIFVAIISQGDYCLLKLFHGKGVVGVYWYGFNLSLQTVILLTANLSAVLFPVMTKMKDNPARLHDAYMRATRILMVIGAPACLLQAALASPLIHQFFSPEWYGSIPVVQLLSIGMAFRLLDLPTVNLIQAEGRFRLYLTTCTIALIAFFIFGFIAALSFNDAHAATAMAAAIALTYMVWQPTQMYLAIRKEEHAWGKMLSTVLPPLLAPGAWLGVVYWIAPRIVGADQLLQAAFIFIIGASGCAGIMWLIMPDACRELLQRMKPYLSRLRLAR